MTTTTAAVVAPPDPGEASDVLQLRPPPALVPGEGLLQSLAASALPMLGSLGSVVFVATSGHGSTQGYAAAGLFVLASLGFVASSLWRSRSGGRRHARAVRRDYLSYLARTRERVRSAAHEQRRTALQAHPPPDALALVTADVDRVWQRSAHRGLTVRYGLGSRTSSLTLQLPPDDAPEAVDPLCHAALQQLAAVHAEHPGLPLTVDLESVTSIEVVGPLDTVRGLGRAVAVQAATHYSPDRLAIAVLSGAAGPEQWDWVKWLPHAWSRCEDDAAGARRLVSPTPEGLGPLLGPAVDGRPSPSHLLLLVDEAADDEVDAGRGDHGGIRAPGAPVPERLAALVGRWSPQEAPRGVTVVRLAPDTGPRRGRRPPHPDGGVELRLAATPETRGVTVAATGVDGTTTHGWGDWLSPVGAEATARRLLGAWGGRPARRGRGSGRPPGLPDLLGLGDLHALDVARLWRPRAPRDVLRVPIGTGPQGEVVHLDLKESARQGSGPHGLLIGATGSGKSELLRTLVLGLTLTHSPDELNLVLVDFKGGATFAGMTGLPHVAAVITNLSAELTLVDRMHDALSGELTRRQELLRSSGGFASRHDHEQARTSGAMPGLAPLPALLVVCDEFSELLGARPELVDLFVSIGRLGRSLGVHLLLASQRLEEGRLRGLDSHLSYRLALRTFSAAESRAVIGTADAHELPPVPGAGLLRDQPGPLTSFTAAYVSGPASLPPDGPRADAPERVAILPFVTVQIGEAPVPPPLAQVARAEGQHASVLDVAVSALTGLGRPAHQIWQPPLEQPDTLDTLLPDAAAALTPGVGTGTDPAPGTLRVPLGTVDRPREQRRDVLWADLSGAQGHVAVVGGPRSGRSTALRTVVVGLALTHTPQQVQVYVIDLGGGTFEALRDLPHVAGVGTRAEPEVVSRIVAEVSTVVDDREEYFRTHAVAGIDDYRARRRAGGPGDGWGDVFLVIDGYAALATAFPDLEPRVQALAQRGLTFGVHLVTSANRWADYRASLRDVLGTRLELRLGDPVDSEIDRRLAAAVPTSRPGRGLVTPGLHVLTALPRVDGDREAARLEVGVADAVDRISRRARAASPGVKTPRLRLLPREVALTHVLALATPPSDHTGAPASPPVVLLGLAERDLRAVGLDLTVDEHLLVVGEARSGRSTAVRTYLQEVRRLHTPDTAQVFLVDPRRTHLGELPDAWVADCATTSEGAAALARDLAAVLTERLPGPDVSPAQLRGRSWWQGREAFVVVDDHELVSGAHGSPLAPLVPLLGRAHEVGLHLVVARRSGGFARVHDPVLTQLRDLAQPALLLSGDPDDGPILGSLRLHPDHPGRGRLLTRRGVEILQVGWVPPVSA